MRTTTSPPPITPAQRLARLEERTLAAHRVGLADWYACRDCHAAWFSRDHVAWNGRDCPTCQVGLLEPMAVEGWPGLPRR